MRRLAALLAVVAIAPGLAGCADEAPAGTEEPLRRNDVGPAPTTGTGGGAEPPKPRGTSERWHFHDHWRGSPTITLLEAHVNLTPGLDAAGRPALMNVTALPRGTVVPPETGHLTINVSWDEPAAGAVNLTYRPADANVFLPLADLVNGVPALLETTESMCDVPHRQESLWRFNFSLPVPPSGAGAVGAPATLRVKIEATIGRPLFIDPPHLDWWAGQSVIPLVADGGGAFAGARTPAANLSWGGGVPEPAPERIASPARVPVDGGRIVPEGTRSIVVLLNWTTSAPDARLTVHYRESNLPSHGALDLAQDGATSRVFVLAVEPPMTDTTYSNRTTWEFHVLPEGEVSAFQGEFTLLAWATRHAPAEAVRAVLGP